MIRPGVAAPIQRGIAPLAPAEPIDSRALIFNSSDFGPQEVEKLRQAMAGERLVVGATGFRRAPRPGRRSQPAAANPDCRRRRRLPARPAPPGAQVPERRLRRRHRRLLPGIGPVGAAAIFRGGPGVRGSRQSTATTRFSAGSAKPERFGCRADSKRPNACLRESRPAKRPPAPNTRIRWAASAPITATSSAPSSISSGPSTWIRITRRPSSVSPTK